MKQSETLIQSMACFIGKLLPTRSTKAPRNTNAKKKCNQSVIYLLPTNPIRRAHSELHHENFISKQKQQLQAHINC